MQFFKQHKGKALEKISAKSLVNDDGYYLSIKRDGRMNQIAYDGKETVKFWTGGGHEYYNEALAKEIMLSNVYAFHVECEYTGDSEGKLGDRGKSGVETKFRTAFNKGEPSPDIKNQIMWVFDILAFDGVDVRQDPFKDRLGMLMQLAFTFGFREVNHTAGCTIAVAFEELGFALDLGYEGIMLTHASHTVGTSGRSNLRIKFKETPTEYGYIIGTVDGKGDRAGTIGAIQVRVSESDQIITIGGLNRAEWELDPLTLIAAKIKFAYESRDGDSYIQARYLGWVDGDGDVLRLNNLQNTPT